MKDIYIKKLVSLNPTRRELKPLEEMIYKYGVYCWNCARGRTQKYKTFKEWLKTEI